VEDEEQLMTTAKEVKEGRRLLAQGRSLQAENEPLQLPGFGR
jgi:hypothetical protein